MSYFSYMSCKEIVKYDALGSVAISSRVFSTIPITGICISINAQNLLFCKKVAYYRSLKELCSMARPAQTKYLENKCGGALVKS